MERITLTRTPTSEATSASLRITIRVKTRPVRVAILAVALLLWGYGAARVALPYIRSVGEASEQRAPLEHLGLLVFAAIGLILAGRLAWIVMGRETFEITPFAVFVRRSIGRLAMRRAYRFAEVEDLPRTGTEGLPPWKLMCLETERESIVLRHRERYVRLARDLDKAEGAYLLTAIRLWMQDC